MREETLILMHKDIKDLIEMKKVIEAVENAFRGFEEGLCRMPPKVYLDLPEFSGDFRAMPARIGRCATLKWVNSHPENRGYPTVMAVVILNDARTGFPLAVMDGTLITTYRTGAASAVASKYLARNDSSTLGLVGCGVQARSQLLAISEVFDIDLVKIYDISEEKMQQLKRDASGYNIVYAPLEEVSACDILSTTTPARKPIIRREWIGEGAHI
ncbi:MAG TPA: ornithine cyclodeaminase family protein, partial [Candidatus Syntrophoarchaeum butanivorans]|nr:ornithine cyclodeaminase family protein [Candidatus Syntrophoarchaeum butanivorans]